MSTFITVCYYKDDAWPTCTLVSAHMLCLQQSRLGFEGHFQRWTLNRGGEGSPEEMLMFLSQDP